MKRLKIILNGLAITILVSALALLINFHTARVGLESLPLDFKGVSPNKTYMVRLKEQRKAHLLPLVHILDLPGYPAEFSVYKNNRPLIENMDIGDDSNLFADLFPEHSWISDSVFWFGDKDPKELGQDEVVVANNSNQAIAYLSVRTCKWENFWLFDLQPNAVVKLEACPQTNAFADSSWIACYGKFTDGRDVDTAGVNFKIREKYKAPGHYRITITDDETKIDSPDFEGYK